MICKYCGGTTRFVFAMGCYGLECSKCNALLVKICEYSPAEVESTYMKEMSDESVQQVSI